jgi:hypothetical protein
MVKKIFLILICLFFLVIFVSTLNGQSSKKITLLSGEEVWDLNGEWDVYVENYGPWASAGSYSSKVKITQTGSSFLGIRMMDNPNNPKGSEAILGELDKSGFKEIQIFAAGSWRRNVKGQISEDGNKMVLEYAERAKISYTRK